MDFNYILSEFDEKDEYETPKSFNYDSYNQQVHEALRNLNKEFNTEFQIDEGLNIQDASFHADIILKLFHSEKCIHRICLRFSNFGKMVSITDEDEIPKNDIFRIKNVLNELNFIYIPRDILDNEYNGKNQNSNIHSWWTRYFDYL